VYYEIKKPRTAPKASRVDAKRFIANVDNGEIKPTLPPEPHKLKGSSKNPWSAKELEEEGKKVLRFTFDHLIQTSINDIRGRKYDIFTIPRET
jgi:hypothetical protein